MLYTRLRKVGGTVMLEVPSAVLKKLGLDVGKTVSLAVQDGKLLVKPIRKPSYKLTDLLAEHQTMALEQNAWEEMRPTGREEL